MPIYLDHNATTAARPAVVEAMQAYLAGPYGNPSSVHRHGRAARDAIEAARERVAALVGAPGLGKPVVRALTQVNVEKGFEAGLAIVILAIILDRVCNAQRRKSQGGPAKPGEK